MRKQSLFMKTPSDWGVKWGQKNVPLNPGGLQTLTMLSYACFYALAFSRNICSDERDDRRRDRATSPRLKLYDMGQRDQLQYNWCCLPRCREGPSGCSSHLHIRIISGRLMLMKHCSLPAAENDETTYLHMHRSSDFQLQQKTPWNPNLWCPFQTEILKLYHFTSIYCLCVQCELHSSLQANVCMWLDANVFAHQLNLASWLHSQLVPVLPHSPLVCFSKCFLFVDFTWSRSVWFCRDLPVRATGPWLHHRSGHPCHRVPAQIHFWPQPSATQWTPFIDICKSELTAPQRSGGFFGGFFCTRLHFLLELRIIFRFWII